MKVIPMKLDIPLTSAKELYEELLKREKPLSPALEVLFNSLEDYCAEKLTWHPTGHTWRFPTIRGLGWMVYFNECPSDSDEAETTLWDRELDRYYVLTGDHREAFAAVAAEGFNALFAVYESLDKTPGCQNATTYRPRGPNDKPLR